jgi:hypothetical protein
MAAHAHIPFTFIHPIEADGVNFFYREAMRQFLADIAAV